MFKIHFDHPLILMLLSKQIHTITAAYTTKNSVLRPAAFLLCVGLTWLVIVRLPTYVDKIGYGWNILSGGTIINAFDIIDRLMLKKWEFGKDYLGLIDIPEEKRTEIIQKTTRMEFGGQVANSQRMVGTAWEVNNVQPFSRADPDWAPSMTQFLFKHACVAIVCYFLNTWTVNNMFRAYDDRMAYELIPFFTRITEVSLEEIKIRAVTTIGHWVSAYCFCQMLTSVAALVVVPLDPSQLRYWRPMFGSITLPYTIRNFWGKFWHQQLQLTLKGLARFATHTILHLPSGSFLARYSNIFFAFFWSGLLHQLMDSSLMPFSESGAIQFFCMQALGIMIEDGVQYLWKSAFGQRAADTAFCRAVGFVWTLAFFVWSSPVYGWPMNMRQEKEGLLLHWRTFWPAFERVVEV